MWIFSIIGLFVVVKFGIRNRRMFMEKEAFYKAVTDLRNCIMGEKIWEGNHSLDTLVKIITEGDAMSQELTLQDDVARIIKRIKEAKENEVLKSKADEVIKKLKAEL